jgi:hypothetical protein
MNMVAVNNVMASGIEIPPKMTPYTSESLGSVHYAILG